MNKRISTVLITAMMLSAMPLTAFCQPTMTEWHDMNINELKRLPLHSSFFAYENAGKAAAGNPRESSRYLSLEGKWDFLWVENADERPADFFKKGYDKSADEALGRHWTTIDVPGIWELNGFGDPVYLNVGYAWRGHFDGVPPSVPVKDNHVGSYRRTVTLPSDWQG